MDTENRSKINTLITEWPRGAVRTAAGLARQGYSYRLLAQYRKSGWIRTLGQGAFCRFSDAVDWTGALYALQAELGLRVHAGGRTALLLKGYAHTLPMGKTAITLFGKEGIKLPKWMREHDWGFPLDYRATRLFTSGDRSGFLDYSAGAFTIRISAPERAALELLAGVPAKTGFGDASQVMEGLLTLRPEMVQALMEQCGSIKAKRLFLYLADLHRLPWRSELDRGKIDLGRGKRTIIPGGMLDPALLLVVPRSSPSEAEP